MYVALRGLTEPSMAHIRVMHFRVLWEGYGTYGAHKAL
jgi:hypothetical protein